MGSSGIKRRKPRRRLPKLRGDLPRAEMNQATALSPAGVPQVFGNVLRAMGNPHKRQRRAATPLAVLIGLPLLVIALITVVALATR